MPLTIIAGRAGSGKSAKIYEKINQLDRNSINSILLVPEQFTLQAERELISSGKKKGFINTNVMSISRLAKDVFSTVCAPSKKLIDERGKAAVLSLVANELKDELSVFARAATFSGFASEAALLISEFKRHDITPEKLKDASFNISGLSSNKISDISKIYNAFESFLNNKEYIDSEDKRNILSQTLSGAIQYKDTHFFIDGFDTFTTQDLKIAKALLNLSGDLTVSINYDNKSEESIFFTGKVILRDLIDMAQSINQKAEVVYAFNPHIKKHPSINHLEENLYIDKPKKYNEPSAIKIYESTSLQEEVENIACNILNLIKQDSLLRFKDISILCCADLNIYSPLFERMFARYDIPCFTHTRKSIAQHPAISYVLSAISAKIYKYQKSDMLAVVKSGYANIDYKNAMSFEDYVLDNAIDSYLFNIPFRRGSKIYNLEDLNILRETILGPINILSEKILPANEHLKNIFIMIKSAGIKEKLETEREKLIESRALQYAAHTSQVYNSLVIILEQLNVLFEDKPMSLQQILLALEESFISTQIGILPLSSDEVLIGELGRSKLAETKYLFVAGAVESNLPPLNTQNSILSDWDIDTLSEMGIDFMKNASIKRSVSDYAIYQALSLPSKGLYLSYTNSSSDGTSLPSQIVKQIEDMFIITAEKATIDHNVSKAAALTIAAKAFGAIGDGRIPPNNWKQAVSALINKKQASVELSKMKMFLSSTTTSVDIVPKKDNVIISSVSQIEQYAGCPFSYMVQYSLNPTDDPGEDITPAGEGAFLHEAMERLGDALSNYDIPNLEDSQLEEIMQKEAEIIVENFDNQQLSRDAKGKYTAKQLIKTAKHGAIIYKKHIKNSKFTPIGQEIAFGEGKELGPINITLENGTKVQIGGKVDRLDTYLSPEGEYARIVDYKSSVKKIDYSKIESGTQLQLLIYMDAYLNKNEGVKASGVFYFPLRKNYINEQEKRNDKMQGLFVDTATNIIALDKDINDLGTSQLINAKIKKDGSFYSNSDNISPKGLSKIINYAKVKATETLSQMEAGEIPVKPITDGKVSQCKYCNFSSICKKDINMHEERVELDKNTAKKLILGEKDG